MEMEIERASRWVGYSVPSGSRGAHSSPANFEGGFFLFFRPKRKRGEVKENELAWAGLGCGGVAALFDSLESLTRIPNRSIEA